MESAKYYAISKAAEKIGSAKNRQAVLNVIDSGRINANDTVNENAAPASDWDQLFTGSMAGLLACNENDRHVVAFFARHGVRA